jgi:hypothetical protein
MVSRSSRKYPEVLSNGDICFSSVWSEEEVAEKLEKKAFSTN